MSKNDSSAEAVLAHEAGEGRKCLKCKDACPGLSLHYWRNICKHCGCSRNDHDIKENNIEVENVPKTPRTSINPPLSGNGNRKIGEGHMKQRMRQFPLYDEDLSYCSFIKIPEESQRAESFLNERKARKGKGEKRTFEAISDQWICTQCQKLMEPNCLAIFADHAKGRLWHPECFVCAQCKELLLEQMYFWNEKDQSVYCGRHDAEKIKSRCSECDELIFGDFTAAESKAWHIEHFCCFSCDTTLGEKEYAFRDNQMYCCDCYTNQFATRCETCGERVSVRHYLSAEDGGSLYTWHDSSKCFSCTVCKKPLLDKPHFIVNKILFCSLDCHRKHKGIEKQHYRGL